LRTLPPPPLLLLRAAALARLLVHSILCRLPLTSSINDSFSDVVEAAAGLESEPFLEFGAVGTRQ